MDLRTTFSGHLARAGVAPLCLLLAAAAPLGSCDRPAQAQPQRGGAAQHPAAAPQSPGGAGDGTEVQLCDGQTTTRVPAGARVDRRLGQQIAADLMAQWTARNPQREWAPDPDPAHAIVPPADNRELIAQASDAGGAQTQGPGHSYGNYSALDVAVWERETQRQVAEGDRVFHDADALGSTIAVSCDMCHPNAANTHPETYPKFQVQLGRVVLLRDMINWCLQHPVRAQAMSADDPRMRALEMYIYAQRRGVPLNYGRH